MQRQTAATAYKHGVQLLLFHFAWQYCVAKPKVFAYFISKQMLIFGFADQSRPILQ